ncbi:MAG: glycoside hydrolase family 5 protein [Candidatus Spyradocola sp.]|jgi:endoglucanase
MNQQTVLPRWKGFNLLGAFTMNSPGKFVEEDFQLISDLGFDFVRLPLNYTFWIDYDDPFEINDGKLSIVDDCVNWGEKYGIHVNVALHRAPGYSVAKDRVEPFDLWRDPEALAAFQLHWTTLAKRYKGIPSSKVSFNMVNEPAGVSPEAHRKVMAATTRAIHAIDPDRLTICDGLDYGNLPQTNIADMAQENVAQSCRAYIPAGVTHYRALWVDHKRDFPTAAWPGGYAADGLWDRERLFRHYGAWAALAQNYGMGVHCGEGGCFNRTPYDVTLRWMEDVLDALKTYNIGLALWNFRGEFGILDSGRVDADYVDYKGHKLDKKMYELFKKY